MQSGRFEENPTSKLIRLPSLVKKEKKAQLMLKLNTIGIHSDSSFDIYAGQKCLEPDYHILGSVTFLQCKAMCLNDSLCVAFSQIMHESPHGCFMYHKLRCVENVNVTDWFTAVKSVFNCRFYQNILCIQLEYFSNNRYLRIGFFGFVLSTCLY